MHFTFENHPASLQVVIFSEGHIATFRPSAPSGESLQKIQEKTKLMNVNRFNVRASNKRYTASTGGNCYE